MSEVPGPGRKAPPLHGRPARSRAGLAVALLVLAGAALLLWQRGVWQQLSPSSEDRAPLDSQPAPPPQLRAEAEQYLKEIVPRPEAVTDARQADSFVTPEHKIRLRDDAQYREFELGDLLRQPDINEDTPITVLEEQEQVEYRTLRQLLADGDGDWERVIHVLEGERVVRRTLRELSEELAVGMDDLLAVMVTKERAVDTTPGALLRERDAADGTVKVLQEGRPEQVATVGELLAGQEEPGEDSLYYVHTVLPGDHQGLWGIIHDGLIENFARGIALRRNERVEHYQVDIPRSADERLEDETSSFLGGFVDSKVRESYVYNFEEGRMGRDPDTIRPAQEVAIIGFSSEELIRIYEHFATRAPQSANPVR